MLKPDKNSSFTVRVVVENPVSGVAYALQRRDGALDSPSQVSASQISFDAVIRVGSVLADGRLNLLGKFVSEPPNERFVYINSGQRAGQHVCCWDRRAKVKLASLPQELVDAVMQSGDGCIETHISGSAPDGGPCCATVKLLASGWKLVV